ncbi:MAG TPA: SDR family oxidoreductase [Bryobacteraceae bacterium]|nr:SDR family oxidoreductase [Bryobacteraceae bacterium]
MPVSLKDQVALVVGASSGIGRAAAVLLAREGAKVMASARRKHRLEELESELTAEGHTVRTFAADAGSVAQMEALAEAAVTSLGPVDLLVYATGTNTPDRSLKRLRPAIWDELILANLNGAYYITQAILPAMRAAGKGHLIYVSSVSGHTPDVSGAAYQASKRGMIGLAHAIRVEERENGIRTCVVCPGLVDTEILEKRPVKPDAATLAKAMRPEDVAEAILAAAKLPPRAVITEMTVVPTYL